MTRRVRTEGVVLKGPEEDGVVKIRLGPYEASFEEDGNGKFRKVDFLFYGNELPSLSIPSRFFDPMKAKANAVFTSRRKRAKNKARKEKKRIQRESIQGVLIP